MEAWQHIKPLAWLDWLLKMPSWKVCTGDSPLAVYMRVAMEKPWHFHHSQADCNTSARKARALEQSRQCIRSLYVAHDHEPLLSFKLAGAWLV